MAEDRFSLVGKVVARTYEVREVVAEGGFGVVYRAYHQGFRAEVALKCLKIPNELTDEQRKSFLEQFRSEAEVLFRLSAQNAHIVRPLHVDAFHTKEKRLVPFMALEWLEGRTLDAHIISRAENGKPPISLTRLVRLLTPVAAALEQAHNLPGKDGPETVVHRDMKPENLFIAQVGGLDVAKILDFGISKVKSTAGQMVGRASAQADLLVSFSPAYGAPEQWAPRRFGQTGTWTDVWGLALSVVEAIKGDSVICGDQAEMMGTILDPVRRPSPRAEGVEVSDAVERIFLRALAVDPRARYQSVGMFWDELTSALGNQSEVGGPVSFRAARGNKRGRTTTGGFDSVRPPAPSSPVSSGGLGAARTHAATELAGVKGLDHPSSGHMRAALDLSILPARSPMASAGDIAGLGGGLQSVASRPRPRVAPSFAPAARHSVWKSLGPSISLLALSVALTLLDRAFAYSRGQPLVLWQIHASWIAGALMIVSIATGVSTIRRSWED